MVSDCGNPNVLGQLLVKDRVWKAAKEATADSTGDDSIPFKVHLDVSETRLHVRSEVGAKSRPQRLVVIFSVTCFLGRVGVKHNGLHWRGP